MKVRLAASAPPTPPDTGASSEAILASPASLWAPRAEATSMVELSTISVPGAAASSMPPPHTASVSLPAGSIVTTASTPLAASAADVAAVTPRAAALVDVGRHEVEALHLVALLDEVAGHGQPHVAEPDEADLGHANVLPRCFPRWDTQG